MYDLILFDIHDLKIYMLLYTLFLIEIALIFINIAHYRHITNIKI